MKIGSQIIIVDDTFSHQIYYLLAQFVDLDSWPHEKGGITNDVVEHSFNAIGHLEFMDSFVEIVFLFHVGHYVSFDNCESIYCYCQT